MKSIEEIKIIARKLWQFHSAQTPLKKSDVIIGLGSYDLRVAVHCAELFQKQFASKIIFTGKDGNWTRGKWQKTEAEVFADKAMEYGTPKSAIQCENYATNISENIKFTKKMLEGHNIKSAIIVTKPNTTYRALVTAQFVWPEINVMVDSPLLTFEDFPVEGRTWEDLTNEMVGDLQRLKLYGEKGFHTKVTIPEDIWIAFELLRDEGFNKHLVK